MTPNQGQGACQALEDAVALGESLEVASDPGTAFEIYEKRRMHRANRAVAMSRQASWGVHIENPVLCAVRDSLARMVPNAVVVRMLDPVLAAER
jgi:2-polyprenyl-6-methoxyphenol hydroxylase-like FAD-dependent oxidoreductase